MAPRLTGAIRSAPAKAAAKSAAISRVAAIRSSVLPGGLRVVTEAVPGVGSVAFGIWVGVGSRDESPRLAGASHFLEHLLFKGTARRSALDIAVALDAVGGESNAFTGKEYTCFYARVRGRDLPLAVDVLCDQVGSSVIASADLDSERSVILDEIAMHEDDPGDVVHDEFAAALYGDHALGRPIIGSVASIEALTRSQVAGYYQRRYRREEMVVAAAGDLEHATVVRLVRKAFDAAKWLAPEAGTDTQRPAPPRRGRSPVPQGPERIRVIDRPTEQANVVLGTLGLSCDDEQRFAQSVLSAALGGGMSSRLFQEVRERRGLAYSVYSFASHHADTGTFGVAAGCQPGNVDELLSVVRDQLAQVADHGITAEELSRSQGQLVGSMVLGLEDTGSRMSRLGKNTLVHGQILSVAEVIARVEAVTLDDVRAVARQLLTQPYALAAIGPHGDHDFSGAVA